MAEGTPGTSKRADFSGAQKNTPRTFDLQSWQGLTEVLKIARESELEEAEYAKFRDLVLRYAQSKGDSELRKKIDAYIERFESGAEEQTDARTEEVKDVEEYRSKRESHAPAASGAPREQTKVQTNGFSAKQRPQPRFASSTAPDADVVPGESRPVPETKEESTPAPLNEPARPVDGPTRASIPAEKEKEEQAPEPPRADIPQEPSRPQENVASSTGQRMSIGECKERIRQIKREVNERAENPIMLMDDGNPIGRNYMRALLEAMKATAGGAAGALSSKMEKLEETYTEVIRHLEEKKTAPEEQPQEPPEPPEPQETPEPKGDSAAEKKNESVSLAPQKTEPVPSNLPVGPQVKEKEGEEKPAERTPERQSGTEEQVARSKKRIESSPLLKQRGAKENDKKGEPKPEPVRNTAPSVVEKEKKIQRPVHASTPKDKNVPVFSPPPKPKLSFKPEEKKTPVRSESSRPEPVKEKRPAVLGRSAEESSVPGTPKKVHEKKTSETEPSSPPESELQNKSTAAPQLKDTGENSKATENLASSFNETTKWEHAPGVASVKESKEGEIKNISDMVDRVTSAQSELSSPEVTQGLDELLDEWSLFKSSGILGMGPSGKDHPLYKQLSVLMMSEVILGRWEGATKERLQILKDYINAWRNEQGISYNRGETFEHYLRRVVQRVQKRQNIST